MFPDIAARVIVAHDEGHVVVEVANGDREARVDTRILVLVDLAAKIR